MREFKYKTSFSSKIKCLVDEDKDKFLAKASLESLKSIIPDEVKKEEDLLAIAFNSCVPNLGNKNGDMIDGKTAVAIYKSFIHKPINIEHERDVPVGHIVNASFSKFSGDYSLGAGSEIIEASEVEEKKTPVNLSLAAVLYRLYNTRIVAELEESSDPDSEKYLSYSASWELAFDDYVLAVGSKYLEECEIISDKEEIEKMTKYLLTEGGSGLTPEGKPIFRLIVGEIIPLGIGITEKPAAEVAGITSSDEEEEEEEESIKIKAETNELFKKLSEIDEKIDNFNKLMVEKSSQNQKEVVKANKINKNTESNVMEKIKSVKDITDKLLKAEETHASDIRDFIDSEVNRISDEFVQKRDEMKKKLDESEATTEKIKAEHDKTKEELAKLQEELQKLAEANAARERQEAFTARMSYFDEAYELDSKTRDIVANKIKDVDEDEYKTQKEELEVLLAAFKIVKHDEENDECGCKSCSASREKAAKEAAARVKESRASTETTESENSGEEVANAVENAQQTNSTVANTTTSEETLSDRAAKAFGKEAWEVKGKR